MLLQKNLETTTDLVSDLPNEISEMMFLDLPVTTLLDCRRVSKSWKQMAEYDNIWRLMFYQKSWEYYNNDSETDSWYELYKERHLLELNWKNGEFRQHALVGHFDKTICFKLYKNWILTGSVDCTIRIWDNETFQCLVVLGEVQSLRESGVLGFENLEESAEKILELTKDINIKFHLGKVTCMDIDDKYLVSGSCDGCCIIWKLPDFKPINRLIIPEHRIIRDIAIYNDYIVCSVDCCIEVWRSSLDNLEDQLPQFNLQRRLKIADRINGICIHNGILYGTGVPISRSWNAVESIVSWNIETGQEIQEFRFDFINRISVNDQYLLVGQLDRITVLDLQTNEAKLLSDDLCIINNKIFSINIDIIRIWDLNDLKIYKNLKHETILSSFPN